MQLIVVATGLSLGVLGSFVWLRMVQRSDTSRVFTALGRSLRSMVSGEGSFFREYLSLLAAVSVFILWNLLGLAGALTPLVAVCVLWQSQLQGHQWLLFSVYGVSSLAGILWFRGAGNTGNPSAESGRLSVSDSQFMFLQLAQSAPGFLARCELLERRLLKNQLLETPVDRPIFITGLARSGTTMLLELLAQAEGIATHRYRDFPFVSTPWFWNRFVNVFGRDGSPVERPHADGISISLESPEAFEEPLWQLGFPDAHQPERPQVLEPSERHAEFDQMFRVHLQKMMIIRGGTRYLSKGNYNVTRLSYLAALFPDALFVVPVRHPVSHVVSLVRQHRLFSEHARHDERVPRYMAAAGHFEFGPQRVPINIDESTQETLAAWNQGKEHLGYALQWAAVYGHVLEQIRSSPQLRQRVLTVRYEDICSDPQVQIGNILTHVHLESEGIGIPDHLDHIRSTSLPKLDDSSLCEVIWETTAVVAADFGYERDRTIQGWSL